MTVAPLRRGSLSALLWGVAAGLPAVLALAVVARSGGLPPIPDGLPDPGPVTRWGLPAVRALRDTAAAGAVGMLVLAAWVLPPTSRDRADVLEGVRLRAAQVGGGLALLWAGATWLTVLVTYSDVSGRPLSAGGQGELLMFVTDFELGRSLTASALLALAAATTAVVARGPAGLGWATALSVAALLPLALSGHAATADDHELAVNAGAAHLIGITVWTGGIAGLLLLRRRLGSSLPAVAARFSGLAGTAYVLVAVSGVGATVARTDGWSSLRTPYGAVLGAKVVALALLGAAGWYHRRRLLPSVAGEHGQRRFVRLLAVEVVVLAAAIGLATALSAISPEAAGGLPEPVSRAESLLGEPMPPPLTSGLHWLTQWRVDSLWVPIALLALGWYLTAVVRLRRRGDRWPVGRTVSWVVGWLMLAIATSASPGVYGQVLFSAHMVQHMTVAMAVPVFLVFGAPVSLAVRTLPRRGDGSRGPREWLLTLVHSRWLGVLGHPLVAAGMFVASLAAFYYSPLLPLALSTHTGHVLMTVHFLLSGYLFASVIVGVDPGPRRPPYPFRMVLLMATFGFHAFFAVAMMSSRTILAEDWFASLGRTWGNSLATEQYLGGALGWAIGDYPIAIMAFAMAWGWIKSDEREARRFDRQAARDGDAALAAYNAHLRRLRRAGSAESDS